MPIDKQRPLPPDLFVEEHLIEATSKSLLLFKSAVGVHMYADDHGRNHANLHLMKAAIHPSDPEVTASVMEEHLLLLDDLGLIGLYPYEGRTLYAMRRWIKISHAAPSRWPAPPLDLFQKRSRTNPGGFSAEEREGARGEEGERAEEGDPTRTLLAPPRYCKAHRPLGTLSPCRPCATTRERFEQWEAIMRTAAEDDGPGPRFEDDDSDLPY